MKNRSPNLSDDKNHPTELDLNRFLSGKLSEHRIAEIERHLTGCPNCCQLIESLPRDDRLSKFVRTAFSNDANDEAGGDETSLPNEESPTPSTRSFHCFQLLRELGHGGFGIVWLAHDTRLQRDVALKIPRTGSLLTRDMKLRFLREASAAAALNHPNVVQVFEAGEHDNICFLATEYCAGNDLAVWMSSNEQPTPQISAWIVERLSSALSHAHERGVLHRDLKPGNILLDPVDADRTDSERTSSKQEREFGFTPKVADFGLAKILQTGEEETATHAILGSAAWMSPEQANGQVVGETSDIYSLGAILYRLLTGRPPHVGESELETLQLARSESVKRPSRFRSNIPQDLEVICLKCLEHDASQRYESARLLQLELQRFLNGQPILARPTSLAERFIRWCRRKPLVALVWFLLFSTAIAATVFSFVLAHQRDVIAEQLVDNQRAEHETKMALYDSRLRQVRLGRLGTHAGRRFDGLVAAAAASQMLDDLNLTDQHRLALRNEVIGCLSLFDMKVDGSWPAKQSPGDTTGIAPHPNGQTYATWTADGKILIRNFVDNAIVKTIENLNVAVPGGDDWKLDLKFSPDGQYLASGGAPNVMNFRVWDLTADNQTVVDVPVKTIPHRSHFDFRNDSQQIAIWTEVGIEIYSLAQERFQGKRVHLLESDKGIGALSFSPYDNRLAAIHDEVIVANSENGEVSFRQSFQRNEEWADRHSQQYVAWHPDRVHLAVTDYREIQLISIADPDSNAENNSRRVLPEHQLDIIGNQYDSGGRFAATSSWDSSTCLWNTDDNQLLIKVPGTALRFSQDSQYLSFGLTGPTIGRWKIADGTERKAARNPGPISSIELALDGRLLIVAGDQQVTTWDTASGRLLAQERPGPVYSVMTSSKNDCLWLAGPNGLFRIAVTVSQDPIETKIELASPTRINIAAADAYRIVASGDGKHLAVSSNGRNNPLSILDAETGALKSSALQINQAHYHSLSHDGRFVAFTRYHGYRCEVFDLVDNQTVASFDCRVAFNTFSPDGRWLVIGDHEHYLIVSTTDWTVAKRIERTQGTLAASVDFNATGKVAAITFGFRRVKLMETETWTELATLEVPGETRVTQLSLSSSGDILAAASQDNSLTIWDLRKIRSGLRELSLDWPADVFGPESVFQTTPGIRIISDSTEQPAR